MTFIQVGCAGASLNETKETHPSALKIINIIKEDKIKDIHLIDANPFALRDFEESCQSLSFYNKMKFYNVAILPIDTFSIAKFFLPKDKTKSDFGSINPHHVVAHIHSNSLQEVNVNSISLNSFINNVTDKNIEYLMIDAEGLDAQLLFSLDFTQIRPRNIIFEYLHTDGIARNDIKLKLILQLLEYHNYSIKPWDGYTLIATLN